MVMHKLVVAAIFFGSPYILFLVLSLIARYSAINMRQIVPWIRALRWLTWFTTAALFLMHFVLARFPSTYAFLALAFSSGVILIDIWASARFVPERISPAGTGFSASRPESQ
jgi:hypothetical protein